MLSAWLQLVQRTTAPKRKARRPRPPTRPTKHRVGDKVADWTLLEYRAGQGEPRAQAAWLCECSCGKRRWVQTNNLNAGASKSCGHKGPTPCKF